MMYFGYSGSDSPISESKLIIFKKSEITRFENIEMIREQLNHLIKQQLTLHQMQPQQRESQFEIKIFKANTYFSIELGGALILNVKLQLRNQKIKLIRVTGNSQIRCKMLFSSASMEEYVMAIQIIITKN
ncbi:UNKNOWN [Stylonychia lemnae]|uniref:Galectin domain-containing protein n=1 Tax=Stylonychia lemnae TaxID=5949 RepID=A0A078A0R2_STYLE|nr:UNKNOWN [Stylonychia lemnae]|eukprot:CDW75043.1 UNKNOWN [Stylonychia lemnae]